jgi:oligopeptide transport system permease protein
MSSNAEHGLKTRATPEAIEKGSSLGRDAWLRLKKNHLAMGSLWFTILIILVSFLLPLVPGIPDPNTTHPDLQSMPAFSSATSMDGKEVYYLLGSDPLGRDVFSRILYGGRVSLSVGFLATLVSLTIGVVYGAVSGYLGGTLDAVMMRIVDILYALPFMIIVIILSTYVSAMEDWKPVRFLNELFGNSLWLLFICIGAVEWLTMSRIVRGQVRALKGQEFIDAARSLGLSQARIIFRHLIPNTLGPVIIYTTLTVPAVMRLEAILSFLGLGSAAARRELGIAHQGRGRPHGERSGAAPLSGDRFWGDALQPQFPRRRSPRRA